MTDCLEYVGILLLTPYGCFQQVADGTRHLPHLWDLCSNEIVVRSAKHILKVISISLYGLSHVMRL